jgi:hypothetical protein
MAEAAKTDVMILVSEADDAAFRRVEGALRAEGLDQMASQRAIGTITGSVAADAIERLKAVPGVLAVEAAQTYQVPPPDSDIQ